MSLAYSVAAVSSDHALHAPNICTCVRVCDRASRARTRSGWPLSQKHSPKSVLLATYHAPTFFFYPTMVRSEDVLPTCCAYEAYPQARNGTPLSCSQCYQNRVANRGSLPPMTSSPPERFKNKLCCQARVLRSQLPAWAMQLASLVGSMNHLSSSALRATITLARNQSSSDGSAKPSARDMANLLLLSTNARPYGQIS